MKVKKFLICCLISICSLAFGQNLSLPQYPKWQTVVPGSLICSPKYTSYGLVALLDGRQVVAITENGVTYWEQSLKRRPEPFLVVSPEDFIYIVTNKNTLIQCNPSGMLLWEKQHSQKITKEPLLGWDGRVFVAGETTLASYDIHGKRKWELSLEESNSLPLFTLNDGSLLYFCKREVNGSSVGLRISPFGEILEEIVFAGKILSCKEIASGLLLVFQGGDLGCYSVEKEESKSLWVLKNPFASEITTICCKHNLVYCFYQNGALTVFDLTNQQIKWSKIFSEFSYCRLTPSFVKHGLVVLCQSQIYGLDTLGKILYTYDVQNDGKINTFYFTPREQLLKFSADWTLSAYSLSQGVFSSERSIQQEKVKNYNFKRNTKTFTGSQKDFSLLIKNGDYGLYEKNAYTAIAKTFYDIQYYNYTKRQQLTHVSSVRDYQKINNGYFLIENLGSTAFNSDIASIIRTEDDNTVLLGALQTVKTIGYDVTGELLATLEARLPSLKKHELSLYFALCDGVVSICRCMGKPAIFTKGKEILTQLMYPQYSSKIRNYAVTCLKKIADFEK
ncbi:MAG: hypothetical protein E7062_09480 [Spirochaetaceae bacterium]|nr:hypothetical protein [Spirochaetaceae bacterium]